MKRILVVEDDVNLGKSLTSYLKNLGYTVVWAQNGSDALRLFHSENLDICLIDVGLPDRDGFEVLKDIRGINRVAPAIFLTARDQIQDKITAYGLGADDYLCKPFMMKELELRMEAICKRYSGPSGIGSFQLTQMQIGAFRFDPGLRKLFFSGRRIRLSHIDSEILKLLYINRDSFVKKETILRAIWDSTEPATSRRLSVYLARIRNYLKPDPEIIIENVYGKGYKLHCPDAPATSLNKN